MKEIRLVLNDFPYRYSVPESYQEMNPGQFRAAVLKVMRLTDFRSFCRDYAGLPYERFDQLPEWVLVQLEELTDFIPRLADKVSSFLIPEIVLPGWFLFGKKSLKAPGDQLQGMSLQQFMTADSFFSYYCVTQREEFIDKLCASLYMLPCETFVMDDEKDVLVPIADRAEAIHRNIPAVDRFGVFMNWVMIKNWLGYMFRFLFPRGEATGKPQAADWLSVFDSFVGDNIPYMKEYQKMECMDAFRILNRKVEQSQKEQ